MTYEFNHVHLKAPDPRKTADWYAKAFDFKILDDAIRDTGDRFVRCETSDGIKVNISGVRNNESMGVGDASAHWGLEHFGINVPDMEAAINRLTGLGAELIEGPRINPNGGKIAFIKVPDDVRIEIIQLA